MSWPDIARREHKRNLERYPSDLTDAEWDVVAPHGLLARRVDHQNPCPCRCRGTTNHAETNTRPNTSVPWQRDMTSAMTATSLQSNSHH